MPPVVIQTINHKEKAVIATKRNVVVRFVDRAKDKANTRNNMDDCTSRHQEIGEDCAQLHTTYTTTKKKKGCGKRTIKP